MERRVSHCLDVHGRRYGPTWAAYDGKLPPLPGWPRNPIAPGGLTPINTSVLVHEKHALQAEVTAREKRAAGKTPEDGASWLLRAARGKLASCEAELKARRRRAGGDAAIVVASSGG